MEKQNFQLWKRNFTLSSLILHLTLSFFQPKARCDEVIMKKLVEVDWNNIFHNPPTPGSSGKIHYADVHRAHQTPDDKCKTTLINFQEVHRAEFNHLMGVLTNHSRIMYVNSSKNINIANLELYVDGKRTARGRRVLTFVCEA